VANGNSIRARARERTSSLEGLLDGCAIAVRDARVSEKGGVSYRDSFRRLAELMAAPDADEIAVGAMSITMSNIQTAAEMRSSSSGGAGSTARSITSARWQRSIQGEV